MTYMDDIVNKSIYILREAKRNFDKVGILWSMGKDSTASLSLCREAFFGTVPFDVIHIDTHRKFPEMYEYREKMTEEWNLSLVIADNTSSGYNPEQYSHFECCTQLKTEALKNLLGEKDYDALIVSIRRDEHGVRAKEHVMSPRTSEGLWRPYIHNPEKVESKGIELTSDTDMDGWSLYASDFGEDCDHVRVHPLLHWTEIDVWRYISDRGVPVNPLYFSKDGKTRYRSLGCMPCTSPVKSPASSIDEVIDELETTRVEERSGRAQDKERDGDVMQKLRALGYM